MSERTFKLEVFSPEKMVYGGDVVSIVALGTEGSMGILYGHAPLLTELKKGPLKILEPDNKTLHLTLDGGFMEVKQNKVVILTDAGEPGE